MKFCDVIGAALAIMALTAGATGQDERPVKIGVLTHMTSVYAAHGGPGSVEAARMAIDDFGGAVLGKPVELIFADHRNNPDLGTRSLVNGTARASMRSWMCQIRALRWRCSNSPEG